MAFDPVFELSRLNGRNGFVIRSAGSSVSNAGDLNGDGFDDLIIGAPRADPNGDSSGASYVVFGRSSSFAPSLELSSLDGSNGFVINGVTEGDRSGDSVSSAGDVNGDGFDDLIIGAPGAAPNGGRSGASYIVFGRSSDFASSLELSSLDGSNGFVINGVDEFDASGYSVSSAGDLNGDGFSDLIIGAPFVSDPNGNISGASYVVFGRSSHFASSLELSSLDGSNGFVLNNAATSSFSGYSVSSAGDINDDGFDDLIIGTDVSDPNANFGLSYVVFGGSDGFDPSLDLSNLDGGNGFVINGVVGDSLGSSVSSAGDLNGDDIDDLIIGTRFADPNGPPPGTSYVVFGRSTGFGRSLELSGLNGSNGFVINGVAENDLSGSSVSSAGDINGDGIDDLIIGAFGATPNGIRSGASYVIFGSNSDFAASLELSRLDGRNGFVLNSVAENRSGFSVSSAGDVNGDGIDDLIISPGYVVFGQVSTFEPTLGDDHLRGTADDDIIRALSGNDIVRGLDGVDRLYGDDGDDTLFGNAGNDILRGNQGNDRIFGGDGNDLLNGKEDDDRLLGGDGEDLLRGSDGDDILRGKNGNDLLNGGTGTDRLIGDDGNDILRGRAGDDVLRGGAGNDVLNGGTENDVLRGETGRDRLIGGNGRDVLRGGRGNDFLKGGRDNDRLIGGNGSDTFAIGRNDGQDRITDFELGTDEIKLLGRRFGVEDLSFRDRGNNTLIRAGDDAIAVLVGVDVATVEANVNEIFA